MVEYRNAAAMTQQDLAVRLDVTVTMVSRWENDRNVPTREHAEEMDDLFEAGGELLRAFGYVRPTGEVAELRERVVQLESLVAELTAEHRRQAEELAGLSAEVRGGRARSRRDGT